MSVSQIPNLLSSRGGPRSRGRGRGRGGPSNISAALRRDQTIQATDTDAAVSRLSAVALGYLEDPFAQYFVNGQGTRRFPIINRGTYTRTNALDILINAFLADSNTSSNPQQKQIISLGAGTDTRYLRLQAHNRTQNLFYHEFDFPAVCEAKFRIFDANRHLLPDDIQLQNDYLERTDPDGTIYPLNGARDREPGWQLLRSIDEHSSRRATEAGYCCHPLDLRNLPTIKEPLSTFHGLKENIPTLIISECCLCYLEVNVAKDVLKWFADRIPSLGVILYEPIGVDDPFGQMMVGNLAARGIVMPTVQRYKSLGDQVERLKESGFGGEEGGATAITSEDIWDKWISPEERSRVDSLEGLDEVEEWQMLARHYAVVWGWRGSHGWETWRSLQQTGD